MGNGIGHVLPAVACSTSSHAAPSNNVHNAPSRSNYNSQFNKNMHVSFYVGWTCTVKLNGSFGLLETNIGMRVFLIHFGGNDGNKLGIEN